MFCPSCGAPNPDEAKFCNQCGAGLGPASGQGDSARPPGTVTGDGARRTGSGQGTLSGMSTHDMAASMVTGPSRRQMAAAGVVIGLLGVAVGAVAAWRSTVTPPTPPVTPLGPVGLLADPAAVTASQTEETDAGTVVAVAPAPPGQRARGSAARAPAAPAAPPAARPVARPTTPAARPATPAARGGGSGGGDPGDEPVGGGATTTASGNTIRDDGNGNLVVSGPDGQPLVRVDRTGADAAATAPLPEAENGVIERGPRSSRGGFREGDETDATGTMDPQAFQFVYRHYQSQIASCWSSASRGTEVSGVMVVRVRIAEADGHVSRTRVISDSTRNATLQACVQNNIRTWRYPRPEGGDVEVDYPLRFGGAR